MGHSPNADLPSDALIALGDLGLLQEAVLYSAYRGICWVVVSLLLSQI